MKRILSALLVFVMISIGTLKADEGMWLPILLKKFSIEEMQKKGFKLSAEDVYSVNQASMKDAIVKFGRGCTGELISDQGLIITNHHCGYGQIQRHSSVEKDFLTNGFWAMSKAEELPNEGLTVTFLVRMEEVTKKVLKGTKKALNETERDSIIELNSAEIIKKATKGTHFEASVEAFYYGNQYYLFVNEVFKDVRLVGAPPSAVGKFGGDTDNWMWPRHTGDFSLFRIYADKNNQPAEYSDDNVPYKPKKHFPISLKGVQENDFTMVFGYPARTNEYLTSEAIKLDTRVVLPHVIDLRTKRLDVMNAYQSQDPEVRIKYASKNAGAANAWKKWQGIIKGLRRLNAVEKKLILENEFENWVNASKKNKKKYEGLVLDINQTYRDLRPFILAQNYYFEAPRQVEVLRLAASYGAIAAKADGGQELDEQEVNSLKAYTKRFFKDYYQPIDKEIFVKMMDAYYKNIGDEFMPVTLKEKYNYGFKDFANELFSTTIFVNESKLYSLLSDLNTENIQLILNDPAFRLMNEFSSIYSSKIAGNVVSIYKKQNLLYRKYMAALMEMQKDKVFYPDANFTLRVAYGQVKGYEAADAVIYDYYTTLDGIMEKDNPDIYDYDVPEALREIYRKKDFGQYESNGTVPVAFVATNHTSGGNSGSPVINANGELIGVNFDRCWEGTMSDYMFDPDYCRNISIDIRYALFIIDKVAGAKHLIDEMTIVK